MAVFQDGDARPRSNKKAREVRAMVPGIWAVLGISQAIEEVKGS